MLRFPRRFDQDLAFALLAAYDLTDFAGLDAQADFTILADDLNSLDIPSRLG